MQHARAILSFKFCATGGEEHPWKNSTTEELSIVSKKGKRDEIGKHTTISVKLCFEPNSLPHENHVQKSNNS